MPEPRDPLLKVLIIKLIFQTTLKMVWVWVFSGERAPAREPVVRRRLAKAT
jgi:hypothetical protein